MQAALIGGFCQALTDARFQALISDFHKMRDTVSVDDELPVRAAIAALFRTIHDAVRDRNEILKLTDADDPDVPELLEGLRAAEDFVHEHAFLDAVTVLCLFRARLKLTDVVSEAGVLGDLDGFLVLLGVRSVSVLALWEECAAYADQRHRIWEAVTGVLYAVRDHCHYVDPRTDPDPPPPPPPVAASAPFVR